MTDTARPEPLPCPFCGAAADRLEVCLADVRPDGNDYFVVCGCDARGPIACGKSFAAVEAWNRRAAVGIPIDRVDRKGRPIHVGDTLRFDPREWGHDHEVTVRLEGGRITYDGSPSDLTYWCEVVRTWDGTQVGEDAR